MSNKACFVIIGLLAISPVAWAADDATRCVDISVPHDAFISRNGTWIELTPDQWQFLRGIYVMNPQTPPGLPYGDKAVLARMKGSESGLVFFIDGDKACTPMVAPPQLLGLMLEVGTGSSNHQGSGI
jgi:hypothetical protein